MDVLSDVLRVVRLTGAVFFDTHARGSWAIQSPASPALSAAMPGSERVLAFHFVLQGGAWAQVVEGVSEPLRLEAGEAVIVAGGQEHVMSSEPGMRAAPRFDLYRRREDQRLPYAVVAGGDTGPETRLSCGFLGCDARPFNPVMEALPPLLVVRLNDDLVRMAIRESETPTPGGETILARLSELLFLQALRQHLAALPTDAPGWLSGLRDRHVGQALALMHGQPATRWTLDTLAQQVGLSRSVFAERFTSLMGLPAMQYLGNWRLQRAAWLIEMRGFSIAQAADAVGYESEAAFNRAFRRRLGAPPGAWRRARANRLPSAPPAEANNRPSGQRSWGSFASR
jgi:AraC-like DNA-binding protein